MTVGICGARSTIAQEFGRLVFNEEIYEGGCGELSLDLDRYLICTGFLAGKALGDLSGNAAFDTWMLNFVKVARFCDGIFAANSRARVCLMGSESGFSGSYDMAYAGAKAALHLYVETKQLEAPEQMLVALAPHIIWDSAMTQCRGDVGLLEFDARRNRLGRWLTAFEVAREAHHLLYTASPALSGQVIRMRAA